MEAPRLPGDTHRLAMVGRTGSGKTQAAAWHLSLKDFDAMPWVVYDFKRDELLNQIPYRQELTLGETPKDLGLHVVHPLPNETAAVEAQMWQLWERGNVGVYVDEGYMVGDANEAFNSLLTQGRSRKIPMVVLSQRPVWMSRFVFSEADFYQVFHLNDRRDRSTVESFIPDDEGSMERLPEYHSYYYDVARDDLRVMRPVPDQAEILATFEAKLRPEEPEIPVRRRRFI